MTAMPILKMGNPKLREKARPIELPIPHEIRDLVEVMKESMAAAGGVGLAAPQIGISKQLVIFSVPEARMKQEDGNDALGIDQTVLINPVIEPLSNEQVKGWEGCLSVPGLRGLVPRYTHIRYSGYDLDGNKMTREAKGFHARVVQHECDHLTGILYLERMTDMTELVYESEMKTYMENYGLNND
ncbi:peptide deformylase [Sneathiella sp. P13V-1]|uniref:peptide deformylase n=1 Tax=Sneathiella sp. P13V-1 TaxID=2697366 RepID=UPI00187B4492|nr:peptide deformylase [Sneathiella sp. P13V-1]MBE7638275.1 peptide deformylase [Sneathiella sp. P13V-1]